MLPGSLQCEDASSRVLSKTDSQLSDSPDINNTI